MAGRLTVTAIDYSQGFFQDFREEGANAAIVGLRGGKNYSSIFQGFCQRGNVVAHNKVGGLGDAPPGRF